MDYLWAALFVLTLATGWVLTLIALPGNWLMVLAAVLYAFFAPPQTGDGYQVGLGWSAVIALAVLATIGELLELLAGALGVAQVGGSKRGAVLAALFSIPGALLGAVVGVPIPFFGPLIGVVVFAGLGAFAGAMLGEKWKGKDFDNSLKVGHGAFWGRILGTVAKVMIASMMVVLGTVNVFWP